MEPPEDVVEDVEWEHAWPELEPEGRGGLRRVVGFASANLTAFTVLGWLFVVSVIYDGAQITPSVAVAAEAEVAASQPVDPGIEAVVGRAPSGRWSFLGGSGASHKVVPGTAAPQLELLAEGGQALDLWANAASAPRIMRAAPDENFVMTAKFSSTPSERYQMQGLIAEAASGDYLRVDAHSDGEANRVFAGATVKGKSAVLLDVPVGEGDASYLSLRRLGANWTLSFSRNGKDWQTAGEFVFPMTVAKLGVFAGKTAKAGDFAALLDEFRVEPLVVGPGVANAEPAKAEPAKAAPAPVVAVQSPAASVAASPASPVVAAAPATPEPRRHLARSDGFDEDALGDHWSIAAGKGVTIHTDSGTLVIDVPEGTFDLWNGRTTAPRILQPTADRDFVARAAFGSVPSQRFQMQGLVLEGAGDEWIRVDLFSNGTETRLFAATTKGGKSESVLDIAVDGKEAARLGVERTGDTFAISYSPDGENWTNAGSFDRKIELARIGVFAGALAKAAGYQARVNSFMIAEGAGGGAPREIASDGAGHDEVGTTR